MSKLTYLQANPRRLYRVLILVLVTMLLAYLMINMGLAWLYVRTLTHPVCGDPEPLVGFGQPPQEHWIPTSDKLNLRVFYYPPQNGAVIMAFGGIGGALGNTLPPVGFLLEKGYGVLQVDTRACARPRASVTLGANEVRDADAAVDFLALQPDVNHIGAMGFSMGGVTAIRSAARNLQIEAIVAEGGFYNLAGDILVDDAANPFYRQVFLSTITGLYWLDTGVNPWQVSPIDDLPKISPRPIYLIYGEYEAESGHAQAQYAAARQPKQFWLVPGGAHGSNHVVASEQYQSSILEFFDRELLK